MVLLQSTIISLLHRRLGFPQPASEQPSPAGTLTPLDADLMEEFRLLYRHSLATETLNAEMPYGELWSEMPGEYLSEHHIVFQLPQACVRPVSLRMAEWDDDVRMFSPVTSPLFKRQRYPLLRASEESPAVFLHADSLIVYGVAEGRKGAKVYADSFRAVTMPSQADTFILSAPMLENIVSRIVDKTNRF